MVSKSGISWVNRQQVSFLPCDVSSGQLMIHFGVRTFHDPQFVSPWSELIPGESGGVNVAKNGRFENRRAIS
jgi:hypothetical protein